MSQKSLHFFGPFSFLKGKTSLFHSQYSQDEGIYLWVIKDKDNNINYIHYIGETTKFAERQKEHLIHILGLNYSVTDAKLAKQGIHKIVWNGMWRDKSKEAASKTLANYNTVSNHVVKYVECIDVYFAPTKFPRDIRRHLEGCIGWNLRNKYPELTRFYAEDNHVGTKKERLDEMIKISSDEPIAGLDYEIEI